MSLVRRVKKYLSWDEYKSLDKRNREVVVEGGEIARVPTHDEQGRELPDPVPLAPPVGWHAQPSMFETMRAMIRSEALRELAEAQGDETFEEAQDFEVDDDDFPQSPHEGDFQPLEDLQERRQNNYRRRFIEEEENASYREWREKTLAERPDSPLHRMSASAPKARPASPRPEPGSEAE